MTERDVTVVIRQMLDPIDEVRAFCRGRERRNLDTDLMLRYAVIHALEVLGQADTRVLVESRSAFSDVP